MSGLVLYVKDRSHHSKHTGRGEGLGEALKDLHEERRFHHKVKRVAVGAALSALQHHRTTTGEVGALASSVVRVLTATAIGKREVLNQVFWRRGT